MSIPVVQHAVIERVNSLYERSDSLGYPIELTDKFTILQPNLIEVVKASATDVANAVTNMIQESASIDDINIMCKINILYITLAVLEAIYTQIESDDLAELFADGDSLEELPNN